MRTSELQVHNLTNIKVVESHHDNFRCFTVSLTSTDYDGNSYTTDLKIFSDLVSQYVFVPLNRNRKAAILSFSYSIGISSLKTCRLLELINSHASKSKIIREWSPYINRLWCSGGDLLVDQRRMELDTYLAPDKTIPTFVPHRCHLKKCLLNLPETYTGAPNQVKAIEYLEKKLVQWDSSGEVLRRFFRYWSEKPRSLGSPQRRKGLD